MLRFVAVPFIFVCRSKHLAWIKLVFLCQSASMTGNIQYNKSDWSKQLSHLEAKIPLFLKSKFKSTGLKKNVFALRRFCS
jgi:hypothetical protein